MAVDWAKLRHVIEAGTIEACADAGLTRAAVRVTISALPSGTPAIEVEVLEVSEELAAMVRAESKINGN